MCGIAGYVNLNGKRAELSVLRAMADRLVHRGPDAEGFHVDGSVGLAHKRLSIIDLCTGNQPMCNEDSTVWTVFNGEIFNFRELRAELECKGHVFKTLSDTEVIVHLYEDKGDSFPEYLNGFFAVAIYDSRKRKIYLARDRAGKKPVVYFNDSEVFAFASEMSALTVLESMPQQLEMQAIWDFLSLQYIPAPYTVYENVYKLLPGHILEFDIPSGELVTRRYWKPDYFKKSDISYDEALAQLRDLMHDSVRRRLISDVPLGVFLSGGMDSAIIAGLVSEISDSPVKCFSIGFDDKAYDERESAAASAELIRTYAKAGFEHHVKVVEPCDFGALELLAGHFGEPYADASMLPTYLLSRFAKESVTVALGGDGADEVFAGYERYLAMKYLGSMDFIPLPVRRMMSGLYGMFGAGASERSFCGRLRRFMKGAAAKNPCERYMTIVSRFDEKMKRKVCSDAFRNFELAPTSEYFRRLLEDGSADDPMEKFMELDFNSYLPCDILPKLDISSMAASLELRSPFLDYRVVEFAASLPFEFKQKGATRKRILGDAFGKYLVPGLAGRRKRGFGVPLAAWFRGAWRNELHERLLEGSAVNDCSIFDRAATERMISEHCGGAYDHSYPLFSMLSVELFLESRNDKNEF